VLIVIAPIAFFIASYINQSDPIEVVNEWMGKETPSKNNKENEEMLEIKANTDLEKEIQRLKKELEFYQLENEKLREQLKSYEKDHLPEEQ